jgi:hypothetical protein
MVNVVFLPHYSLYQHIFSYLGLYEINHILNQVMHALAMLTATLLGAHYTYQVFTRLKLTS